MIKRMSNRNILSVKESKFKDKNIKDLTDKDLKEIIILIAKKLKIL